MVGGTAERDFNVTLYRLTGAGGSVVIFSTSLTTTAGAKVFGGRFPREFFSYNVTRNGVMNITTNVTTTNGVPITTSFTVFTANETFRRVHGSITCPRLGIGVTNDRTNVSANRSNTARRYLRSVNVVHAVPNVIILGPTSRCRVVTTAGTTVRCGNPICVHLNELTISDFGSPSACAFRLNGNVALRRNGSITIVTAKLIMGRTLGTIGRLRTRNVGTHLVGVRAVGPVSESVVVGTTGRANEVVAIRRRGIVNNLNSTIYSIMDTRYPIGIAGVNIGSHFNCDNPTLRLLSGFNLARPRVTGIVESIIGRSGWFLGWFGGYGVLAINLFGPAIFMYAIRLGGGREISVMGWQCPPFCVLGRPRRWTR